MSVCDDSTLLARADELLARAEKGEITNTHFLTPREEKLLLSHFAGRRDQLLSWGGYPLAERRRIYFLPPYLADMEAALRAECLSDSFDETLCAVQVSGSGYRELSHRDFLGAILHLGVERDRIGDICVTEPHTAILFCDRLMSHFLAENLSRVASDAVRVCGISLPDGFDGGKKFEAVSDTVPSPRADAVVAALLNLSRERAQALFREGRVEIDYEVTERTDKPLAEGMTVSIRGYGKFTLRSLSDKTRKGRLRLVADRHI